MKNNNEVAKIIVNDVFCLQEKENLVITVDKKTDRQIISAILEEANSVGGNAIAIEIPEPEQACAGVNDFVSPQVKEILAETHCWIDAGAKPWIYSDPFEYAFENNEKLRYMVIGGIDPEGLYKLFGKLNVNVLRNVTDELKKTICKASNMRFKCNNGTDFTIDLDHNHFLAADIGDASVPGFHTPPALLNVVPKFGSVNGKFVTTALMIEDHWTLVEKPVNIEIERSKIVEMSGEEDATSSLAAWLDENGDEASSLFAHLSLGLSPNILTYEGDVLYDERILGGLNCGFGHVSPMDAPPIGQKSKTHFDAITLEISVWIDDVQVMKDGYFYHDNLKKYNSMLRG